ncbi:response regulator transcription factor [Roseateles oligotrophus]|uniref:Response regulator transcription factor n=1 Tax=Roseateles oligotrophus TaxID=1769250 RepID=A0ABT2YKL1_9BURK|nr:response regulator transcription factor [Roseateles oligotrophus]MCV2370588.1 response regulator transcription factor [Roseateles oligotrophus]
MPAHHHLQLRCLVVDDDLDIRESLQSYLRGFGMSVEVAAGAREMQRRMTAEDFDVVVLDLMLPDGNGLDLCRWIQTHHARSAVIMLTAQGDPISRVLGLEMGADDYLGKPFEPRELVARINALQRRMGKGAREVQTGRRVSFEQWTFDRVLRQLESPAGVMLALSNAEYRLLSAFIERPGRILTREQLIELTRAPGVEINDRSIDLAVSRLRQKLGDTPPRLIRTLRGEGYLFDVKLLSSS